MAVSVQMPALGESVTEGTVTRWLKQEGDTVEVDEPLLEVSTDKVDTEIPSPAAGVLTKIVAQEDDTVEVGGELAVIGEAGEAPASAPAESAPAAEAAPAPAAQPEPEPEPQAAAPAPEPAPAAPAGGGSATSVKMPELGESVTEGTVTRWLKKVGDSVEVDDPLVEVSTDKVDTEIPSPVAGTLLSITAEEDDTVAVGGELVALRGGGGLRDRRQPHFRQGHGADAAPLRRSGSGDEGLDVLLLHADAHESRAQRRPDETARNPARSARSDHHRGAQDAAGARGGAGSVV